MKCPICINADLVMSERQGIEIDYCPNCRGVWLDRGELDKIIEKAVSNEIGAGSNPQQHRYDEHKHKDYQNYRKKHWLSELFD